MANKSPQKTDSAKKNKVTIDPKRIRMWVEERGGRPSREKGTGGKKSKDGRDETVLGIDFAEPGTKLEPLEWDEFFEIFDENGLAFLYEEATPDGEESRVFKFVDRETNPPTDDGAVSDSSVADDDVPDEEIDDDIDDDADEEIEEEEEEDDSGAKDQ